MKLTMFKIVLAFTLSLSFQFLLSANPARVTVNVAEPGHEIPQTLWGVFFEDINLSADGGIYPELVKNRSFEDSDKLESWKFASLNGRSTAVVVQGDETASPPIVPLNATNRRSLYLKLDGGFTLENDGYWGMNLVQGEHYTLKLAARAPDGKPTLVAKLFSADGRKMLASGELKVSSANWSYYYVELTAADSDPKSKLVLTGEGSGTLFLDMVSLMPNKTWKDHGLRVDLAESIHGLSPAFMRFPGGCWVEGETIDKMYRWKKTIGDVDVRTPLWNIWNYYATHGLGFHEYLQFAEDLGAEPLFDVNCGISHKEVVPTASMKQWVQDALDAIEYANGPTNSYWGGMRARAGHPAPFNLKYMEIGNENGGEAYRDRWPMFVEAIKEKYPQLKLVANYWQGAYPQEPRPDIVDEHFYSTPDWFMAHSTHFDSYDRNGPKIFVGEYAVTRNCGLGNLRGAIGEAAFMTGLERNSDIVVMASYAPLLVNLNHRAWNPDLINFDSSHWYGLPSYYVQKLFAENRGDVLLPTRVEDAQVTRSGISGCIGVGTWNTRAEFKNIKVTEPDGKVLFASDWSNTNAWKFLGGGNWEVKDDSLQQTAEKEFVRAIVGDKSWSDYTLEVRARKLGGREGFLVLFGIKDDEDRTWWNIGGWNNTAHAIELGETRDSKKGSVENNRWYDIRVQLRGPTLKCWLNGKLVHEINDTSVTTQRIYASSALDRTTGDAIVKIVNTASEPTEVELALEGAKSTGSEARALILTSADGKDENSLREPERISPKVSTLNFTGNVLRYDFPGNSLTVLRIPGAKLASLENSSSKAGNSQ
jgi:alpha-L-arabinofuranosidase